MANLKNFRQFYLTYPDFDELATHCVANLSWSHVRLIMRLENPAERSYYLQEANSTPFIHFMLSVIAETLAQNATINAPINVTINTETNITGLNTPDAVLALAPCLSMSGKGRAPTLYNQAVCLAVFLTAFFAAFFAVFLGFGLGLFCATVSFSGFGSGLKLVSASSLSCFGA